MATMVVIELKNICDSLSKATLHAANKTQQSVLQKYIEVFRLEIGVRIASLCV
jgi:hypothetical protein